MKNLSNMIWALLLIYYLAGMFTIKAYFHDLLWKYSWVAQQKMILVWPYYFIDLMASIVDMVYKILRWICDNIDKDMR